MNKLIKTSKQKNTENLGIRKSNAEKTNITEMREEIASV